MENIQSSPNKIPNDQSDNYQATTPPVPPASPKNNLKTILIICGAVIVILMIIVGYLLLRQPESKNNNLLPDNQPESSKVVLEEKLKEIQSSPTEKPGNLPEPTNMIDQNVVKNLKTMEEALSFALTQSGMQYADTAKVSAISVIYTPSYKQWKFTFVSRINPHKLDAYSKTLYDFPETVVTIKNDDYFNAKTNIYIKDSENWFGYENMVKPTEVALSSFFDLAQQKVNDSGLQAGIVLIAKYERPYFKDNKGTWVIDVVLAGEEENDQKKARQITFENGNFKSMKDTTISISQLGY